MQSIRPITAKILATLVGLQTVLVAVVASPAAFAAGSIDKIANHIVISEIQVAGDSFSDEFIELYNPTNQAVELSSSGIGLKLVVREDDGDLDPATLTFITGRPTSIAAGGFYLIANNSGSFVGVADATYSNSEAHLDGDGRVIITTGTDAYLDMVGWGAQPTGGFEGTVFPSTPADNTSIERLPGQNFGEGNGIDTHNNALDFIARNAPGAQNASAAPQFPMVPNIADISPVADSYAQTQTPAVSATVTDTGAGIDETKFTLTVDGGMISSPLTFVNNKVTFTGVRLGEGTHTALLTATDKAGFVSSKTWNFTIDTIKPTVGIEITKFSPKTNQLATTVKLTANDGPQGMASGLDKMQIAFDGVLDNEPWETFSSEFTRNLMNKEGLQAVVVRVSDKAGNISDVASTTTTLEFGTIAAPVMPVSSTTTSTSGNMVTITWAAVPNAAGYLIRYNDGQTLYGPLTTTGTSIVISNLDPKKTYRFEVATVSNAGAVTAFTKVLPPELTPAPVRTIATVASPTPSETVVPETAADTSPARSNTGTTTPTASPSASPETTISPAPSLSPTGDVKSDTDNRQPDWTKVIVALSILIIAAGVATGGWYLYQWWTSQPKDKEKKNGKGGRW